MIESAFLHLQISLEKKRMNISQLTENYRSLLEKKRDTLQLFYEEKLKNYKELIVGNKALRDLVYDHIKKLSLNA